MGAHHDEAKKKSIKYYDDSKDYDRMRRLVDKEVEKVQEATVERCRECKIGTLKIVGTGSYGDTIEVECEKCGEFYEVESDGLGQGGMEWVEAKRLDMEKNKE